MTIVAGVMLVCQTANGQNFVRLIHEEIDYSRTVEDSLLVRIPFPHAVSNLQNYPKINIAALELMQMLEDPEIELDRVYVCGSTSPEGLWGENVTLSKARTENVARYIQYALDIPESKIIRKSLVEDWDRLADMIEESDIPYKYEALRIIRTMDWGERKTALRKLGGGKVWKILEKDFFPEMRSVRFGIFCKVKPQPAKPRVDTVYIRDTVYIYKELIREAPKVIVREQPEVRQTRPTETSSMNDATETGTATTRSKKASRTPAIDVTGQKPAWHIGLKTNLLSDAMVIPDLGIEFQLGRHLSLNLEGWYTPFNIFVPDDKTVNVYGFRPQFRIWFGKETMKRGSYLGIDGACMWYTMQWRDGLLYQNGKEGQYNTDAGNSAPVWSAGFSYGYSLGLGRKAAWGLEFELGLGYEKSSQNVGRFNEVSEKWEIYDFQSKQRVGITHANINLTYRFSIRKKNS
ncbi:MAG: DUF3575 domain-containing protein [Candidatus Cryptobacteroides sp.]